MEIDDGGRKQCALRNQRRRAQSPVGKGETEMSYAKHGYARKTLTKGKTADEAYQKRLDNKTKIARNMPPLFGLKEKINVSIKN
jgi:hypothetical protein